MALADRANQYIDKEKPWIQAKDSTQIEHVVRVCSLGINLFRTLMVYLKPVVPGLTKRAEEFLNDRNARFNSQPRRLMSPFDPQNLHTQSSERLQKSAVVGSHLNYGVARL